MPKPKTNATRTDAQREAANRWTYKNRTVIGCKVDRETAERYKAHCAAKGTTVNAEIKSFVLGSLGETETAGGDDQEQPET